MRACILFSAFFLLTSVGLGSNVGVDTILAPRGTIDSGQTIIPRCIVVNYGDSTASLWTFFAIDDGTPQGYLDSLYLPALAPAQRETLEYQPWIPRGRDSMTATAWTVCTGDTFHGDDTCRLRFLSRVKDVAVTQMINPAPDTTYDSGYVIRMQCRAWNFGNQSLRFALRFRIYEFDSTVVFEAFRYLNLIAGGSTVVTCLDSCELEPGVYVAECYAIVPGDLHPENNVKRDTFWVRGVITHDVAAGPLILNGPNPIRVGDTVIPGVWLFSSGPEPESLSVYVYFDQVGGSRVYDESLHVFLPDTAFIYWFPAVVFAEPGQYDGTDSVYLEGDQNNTNDVQRIRFEVLPAVGVEEGMKDEGGRMNVGPTILFRLPPGAVAFDATGRRSLNPKSGVYFVLEYSVVSGQHSGTVDGARNTVHVRKVIIQK